MANVWISMSVSLARTTVQIVRSVKILTVPSLAKFLASKTTSKLLTDFNFVFRDGTVFNGNQCQDVNECENNPCPRGTKCTNTFGSYTCDDVDECATRTHNCSRQASCQNTSGSFICKCQQGYQGNLGLL